MDALIAPTQFIDFGPDELYPLNDRQLNRIEADRAVELRSLVREHVPKRPGVYGMIDCSGQLIYVGKSKCLRNRLISYFLPNNEEDKSGRIVQSTVAIVWEEQPSEFAALLREQWLIRKFQPPFNVQGVPRRQRTVFVCLGRSPAEQFYTSSKHDPRAMLCVGPLTGRTRAARAVEVLNRIYGLRDCTSNQTCKFADQMQLFDLEQRPGCIRLEIQSCLGPCVSACTRTQYQHQVDQALEFLAGQSDWPVQELENKLQRAVDRLHFELAGSLHEDFLAVRWLRHRLRDLELARQRYTFIYEIDPRRSSSVTSGEAVLWYLIRHGCVEGCVQKPDDIDRRLALIESIHGWFTEASYAGISVRPRPETLPLVASWFRRHKGELAHTFAPHQGFQPLPSGG